MTPDTHWRARLNDVQDLLFVAHTPDAVAKAVLHLTAVLQDEWPRDAREHPAIQLVREAFDLLQNPETQVDLREWLKAAAPIVGPHTVIGRPVLQRVEDR
jgi:hypothetical protein